jgi:hypothetical protein
MADSVPWWGVPVLVGVFTLLAAILSQAVVILLDARRSKRENERRWDEEKREAYLEFARVGRHFGVLPPNLITSSDYARLANAHSDLMIFGDRAAITAATDVMMAMPVGDEPMTVEERMEHIGLMAKYREAARAGLGIPPLPREAE